MSAPTREEFEGILRAYKKIVVDCERCSEASGMRILTHKSNDAAACVLAAYDALADERDEWKRWAELEAVSAYDLLARAAKAEAERDAARALVRDLRDSSPCDHFDHHGHCQTHGWMETDPPCPHGRATKLLEALGEK